MMAVALVTSGSLMAQDTKTKKEPKAKTECTAQPCDASKKDCCNADKKSCCDEAKAECPNAKKECTAQAKKDCCTKDTKKAKS